MGVDRLPAAKFLASAMALHLNNLWIKLSVELSIEAERLIDEWFKRECEDRWRKFSSGDHARELVREGASYEEALATRLWALESDAEATLERLQAAYHARDYGAATEAAEQIAAELPESFDHLDRRFTVLRKAIMRSLGAIEEARTEWARGNEGYTPTRWPTVPSGPPPSAATPPSDIHSLQETAELYLRHRTYDRPPTNKMLGQLRSHIKILLDHFGPQTRVSDVTSKQAGDMMNALRSLPPHKGKVDEIKGLSLVQAAQEAQRLGLKPMNLKTVNNYMTLYRGIFSQAAKNGDIDERANPFRGKSVRKRPASESERGFTEHELDSVFRSPVFVGCEREGRPFQPGSHLLSDWRFWLPLVAMATGARIGEICQLTPSDILERDGVWTISINTDGEKRTKTAQSTRVIPIHSELIRLGLVRLSGHRPMSNEPGSLFSYPKPKNGDWGHKAGVWFREKFLSSLSGAKRTGTGFHSFRHNLETGLRNARVRDDIGHKITGHKTASVAAGYGSYDPATLKAALETVEFPPAVALIVPRYGTLLPS